MGTNQSTAINVRPRQTVERLLAAFPARPALRDGGQERLVPIGIEVEVPWRAYFPDLWVEGFPNVDPDTLAAISHECTIRERVLLPRLQQTVTCGVNKGADRYWEFAFDPATDVTITCNQVAILRANNLIPPGQHSLHITLGGLRVDQSVGFVALALEAFACTPNRIRAGFGVTPGWARKGHAGLFQKEGDHDVQHGYNVAAEVRLLYLPQSDAEVFTLLDVAQQLACDVADAQAGCPTDNWLTFANGCRTVLTSVNLPATNWKTPRLSGEVWERYADRFDTVRDGVKALVQHHYHTTS